MRTLRIVLSVGILALLVSGPASADQHEMAGPAAGITFVLDPAGNHAQMVEFAKRANDIATKLGVQGKQRIFNVAFGGPTSDHVVIVVEFPNMAALAASTSKINASPEYRKLTADVRAAGIRLVSRSVMVEMGK